MNRNPIGWAASVRGITGTQKLVLFALANRANAEGECWPSVPGVAADCCISERAARNALRELEAAGLVSTSAGGGRHRNSLYRLAIAENPARGSEKGNVVPGFAAGETRHVVPETRHEVPERGHHVPERGHHVPPKPQEPPSTLRNPQVSRDAAAADGFEAWWRAYPRKVGRDAARKAFAAALRRGATGAELLIALARQRWPAEGRFIPHPTTWLNQGRWADDPAAAAPPDRITGRRGRGVAGAIQLMQERGDLPGEGARWPSFDIDGSAVELSA